MVTIIFTRSTLIKCTKCHVALLTSTSFAPKISTSKTTSLGKHCRHRSVLSAVNYYCACYFLRVAILLRLPTKTCKQPFNLSLGDNVLLWQKSSVRHRKSPLRMTIRSGRLILSRKNPIFEMCEKNFLGDISQKIMDQRWSRDDG